MAQLQVPIPDELMTAAKTYALKNGMTLKELVRLSIERYTSDSEPTPEPEHKKQTPAESKKEEPKQQEPMYEVAESMFGNPVKPEDCYLLRRTAKKGKPVHGMATFNIGPIEWYLMHGYRQHYDADGSPIPFRYDDDEGKITQPSEEELKQLEEYFGKPVKIEE